MKKYRNFNFMVFYIIISLIIFLIVGYVINYNLKSFNKIIDERLKKLREDQVNIYINNNKKKVNYMWGTATAYTPSEKGINSDSDPTRTSTMTPAKNGVIAVNPRVIPYGSEVMIIHNNTVIRGRAEDTGGAMRKNPKQVDILMEDLNDAVNWGRKEVHIIWW